MDDIECFDNDGSYRRDDGRRPLKDQELGGIEHDSESDFQVVAVRATRQTSPTNEHVKVH